MADEKLTPMAMSKKEAKDRMALHTSPGDSPKYPWGLSLTLDTASLKKLKVSDLPKVGSYVTVTARCCVKGVSESEQIDGDQDRSVSLQIEDMKVEPAKVMRGSVKRSTKAKGDGY